MQCKRQRSPAPRARRWCQRFWRKLNLVRRSDLLSPRFISTEPAAPLGAALAAGASRAIPQRDDSICARDAPEPIDPATAAPEEDGRLQTPNAVPTPERWNEGPTRQSKTAQQARLRNGRGTLRDSPGKRRGAAPEPFPRRSVGTRFSASPSVWTRNRRSDFRPGVEYWNKCNRHFPGFVRIGRGDGGFGGREARSRKATPRRALTCSCPLAKWPAVCQRTPQ